MFSSLCAVLCIEQLFKKNKEPVSNFRVELIVLVFHQNDANSCFQQIQNSNYLMLLNTI